MHITMTPVGQMLASVVSSFGGYPFVEPLITTPNILPRLSATAQGRVSFTGV